jgi:predicted Fe-Mo cluster-binding NifX family protein
VLIAIPNCRGRVSPVFDVATRLVLVRLEGETEVGRNEGVLCEEQSEGIVRGLGELGVEVLICGAISQGLRVALEFAGVRVLAQVCGEIGAVVAAYRTGGLNRPEFIMPGCCRQSWDAPDGNPLCRTGKASRRTPLETHHETRKCACPALRQGKRGVP